MNWEWLYGAIPGGLALIAVIYGKIQDRRQKREELDQTAQARKEPTWNELVTENRSLRQDVTELRRDFNALEGKMDRKVSAFESIVREIWTQWPADYEAPVFNSEDLLELQDTSFPWKHRVRIVPGLA